VEALRAFEFPATLAYSHGLRAFDETDRRILSDLYDAEVATVDAEVGRFLDELRKDGTLDRTIVVVVGDHGENLGEHGLYAHRSSLHRTIRHVPLVVRYPPELPAGRVEDRVVRLEDVPPTILELCDLPGLPRIDGASLLGDLDGRLSRAVHGPMTADFLSRAREVYPEATGADFARMTTRVYAVFDGRHHLIVDSVGGRELYDLRDDPGETRNLARERPDVARRLGKLLPRLPDR
jgi:arylsulfatase A-like enzyme